MNNYEIFKRNIYSDPVSINGMTLQFNKQPYLDIVLTDMCNRKCSFCIANLLEKKENCDLSVFKSQIEYAIDNFGVKEVLLLGGEPTISRNLFEILHFVYKKKSCGDLNKICITTNGDRLKDGGFLDDLVRYVTHINISLMSTDTIKQRVIGKCNSYLNLNELQRIYIRCQRNGVKLRINTNVFTKNNDTLYGMLEFYNSVALWCHSVKFSPLLKTDNFSVVNVVNDWVRQNILSDDDYEKLFKSLEDYYSNEPIVRNPLTFGFVEYSMICLDTPIILNYNHRGMMAQKASAGYVNNLKLLTNGNLSLSWNKEDLTKVIRFAEGDRK